MSVKLKDGGFPATLDTEDQGLKLTFKNREAVLDFLQKERAQWDALSAGLNRPVLGSVNTLNLAGLQTLTEATNAMLAATDDSSFLSALETFDREKPLILQGTLGPIVLERANETDPQTNGVLWALAAYLNTQKFRQIANHAVTTREVAATSYGQSKLTARLANGRADRAQIKKLLEEAKEQLRATTDLYETSKKTLEQSLKDLSAGVGQASSDSAQQISATESSLTRLIQTTENQLDQITNQAQQSIADTVKLSTEEMDEFKRKVRIDVGLEAPSKFWTDKADGHRLMAGAFGALFLLAVGLMVWWIESSAVGLVAEAVDRIVGDREAAALSLVPIAFITVPALAFAWVLRHLSRIIIQNLSLEADARLRGTITMTFKALAADRAMNDAELAIALQALFRPIDGKDHSEIAPPSLGDILKLGGDGKA